MKARKGERAQALRDKLRLLDQFRATMVRLAPMLAPEGAVWLGELRARIRGDLDAIQPPNTKTPDRKLTEARAWALLYALYEKANPSTATPGTFATAAALAVKNLRRYRNAAPPEIAEAAHKSGPRERRRHFEEWSLFLGLKGTRREKLERLLFPAKVP